MQHATPGTYIGLLRGINVGGKHILPMKDLAAIMAGCGARDVRTYIQSGNVVFRAGADTARKLPALAAKAVANQFGFDAPVVILSARELAEAAAGNPFPQADTYGMGFLRDKPAPALLAKLDPDRSPPDRFVVRGRIIYLQLPNGAARTKLTAPYFDAALNTVSTFRNWRTVLKLLELTRKGQGSVPGV